MKTINHKRFQAGMTLMDVLITVLIIGILSAIALPNYLSYRERTNLAEAKTNMIEIYQFMAKEKLSNPTEYLNKSAYENKLSTLKSKLPAKQREKYNYTYTVDQQGSAYYVYMQAYSTNPEHKDSKGKCVGDKFYLLSDSVGEVYKCPYKCLGSAGAVGNKTKPSGSGGCEKF